MKRLLGNLHWILFLMGCLLCADLSFSQTIKKPGFTSAVTSSGNSPVRPLTIGDKVPDLVLDKLINSRSSRVKFSDFKGKLVIVDFWATFCGPCIAAFPKMQSLLLQFDGKLQILAVTRERRALVDKFLQNNKIGKQMVSLPIVYEDTLLGAYFKHQTVPHEVWINGDGYVLAITCHEYVTKEYIQQILNGNKIYWPVKLELEASEVDQRLFSVVENESAWKSNSSKEFYTGFTGYKHGRNGGNYAYYDSVNDITRYNHYNTSIVHLYALALGRYLELSNPKRSILKVNNYDRFVFYQGTGYENVWYAENSYCYEAVLPGQWNEAEVRNKLKNDLDLFLGLKSKIEKRKIRCLVLKPGDKNLIRKSSNHLPLYEFIKVGANNSRYIQKNSPLRHLVFFLNNHEKTSSLPLVVDETGYEEQIDLELNFHGNPIDMDDLKNELNLHGLNIVAEEREVEMLILEKISRSK
jgi:thiol-disulfide isomerase/thioredoxin